MLAVLFIVFAGVVGWYFRKTMLPETEFTGKLEAITPELSAIPNGFLTVPMDLLSGLTLTTTLIYFAAWLSRVLFPTESWFPIALWWGAALAILNLFLLRILNRRRASGIRSKLRNQDGEISDLKPGRPRLVATLVVAVTTGLSIVWALLLTRTTFFQEGTLVHAGFTVFSDLSPHTALTRSFGVGGNVPANYPHFAGAGMNYHFFFYFLAGLLNALGFSVEWALNLPSILGTVAFVSGLGYLAVFLSGRKAAWPLTFALFCLRSSLSGFVLLRDQLQAGLSLGEAVNVLRQAESYAGPLLHDDWGLYNLNVYANQRHLLWGLALVVYIFLLFLPSLQRGEGLRSFGQSRTWPPSSTSQILYPLILVFPLSYWHGSATIALLLVLACWALFSQERLRYLAVGLSAVLGALLFRWIFSSGGAGGGVAGAAAAGAGAGAGAAGAGAGAGAGSSFAPSNLFQWGYILEDKSLTGVLSFLVILYGVEILFMIAAFVLKEPAWKKRLAFSFLLPMIFGLTVSLTPDVTVNHKYFMMTQLFFLPFTADYLLRLWTWGRTRTGGAGGNGDNGGKGGKGGSNLGKKILLRILTIVLLGGLTFTGLTDYWAYRNQSQFQVVIETDDAFSKWVYDNMGVDEISLTPPWAMHSYFYTGRQSFYGHSYYAQSAGYDVDKRLNEIRWFLSASTLDETALRAFVEENKLSYLMIDDSWRQNPDYYINENNLQTLFPEVASFPEQGNLTIYRLKS